MKLTHLLKSTTIALALATGLGASALAEQHKDKDQGDQKVEMKDLPAAVQKTIQDHLAGGAVTGIDKESENGQTRYSADVKQPDGKKSEIKVAEDGKLIKASADDDDKEEDDDDDKD